MGWFLLGCIAAFALLPLASQAQSLQITEFMAENGGSSLDEDGEASDWIEVHNPTSAPVSLSGWSLTDDPANARKWILPDRNLGAGGFLVVWASGKNRTGPGPLHANFRLGSGGEYLGLFPPAGTAAASEFKPQFPPQNTDVSYGIPSGGRSDNLLANAPVWILIPEKAGDLPADWASAATNPAGAWQQVNGFGLGFDSTPAGPGSDVNVALGGIAGQSTTGFGLPAELAIDGDPDSFTHTDSNDNASAWWVDLPSDTQIQRIVVRNRSNCCPSRLRDITVQLIAADGKTVVWSSELLNPENILGGPAALTVDLFELNVGPIEARRVRVSRTPDPDLSGSGGGGNEDEDNVLSLGEVEVYGVGSISYAPLVRSDPTLAMLNRSPSAFVRVPLSWTILPLSNPSRFGCDTTTG